MKVKNVEVTFVWEMDDSLSISLRAMNSFYSKFTLYFLLVYIFGYFSYNFSNYCTDICAINRQYERPYKQDNSSIYQENNKSDLLTELLQSDSLKEYLQQPPLGSTSDIIACYEQRSLFETSQTKCVELSDDVSIRVNVQTMIQWKISVPYQKVVQFSGETCSHLYGPGRYTKIELKQNCGYYSVSVLPQSEVECSEFVRIYNEWKLRYLAPGYYQQSAYHFGTFLVVPKEFVVVSYTDYDFRHPSGLYDAGTWNIIPKELKGIRVIPIDELISTFERDISGPYAASGLDSNTKYNFSEILIGISENMIQLPTPSFMKTVLPSQVTLVTHLTLNRIDNMNLIAHQWRMSPLSIVVYLNRPGDLILFIQKVYSFSSYEWVSHAIITLVKAVNPDRKYPINYLRNVGIERAPTDFVLLIDADFLPSDGLYDFAAAVVVPRLQATQQPTVYVVPSFTAPAGQLSCTNIKTLTEMFQQGTISIPDPGSGHGPTRYGIFFDENQSEFYEVCYESQWEPYYILKKEIGQNRPVYDERFANQGGDKQSHALLLNAIGYRFMVIRNHFLVHLDHPSTTSHIKSTKHPEQSNWDWPGGFRSGSSRHFSYFTHYIDEIESNFGRWARFPKGCKHALN